MNSQPNKSKAISGIIDYVELFVIAICVVIVLFSGILRICTVDGESMIQTLQNQEMLVVSDAFYTPERGDIIVFHQTSDTLIREKNKPLVKRVIGVGGDKITIDYNTWVVTITDKNGNTFVADEDYKFIDPNRSGYFYGIHEYTVPEGCLFVMGDNRNNSLDSRYLNEIGYVDERRVLGKVILRVSPLSKLGTVD